MLLEAREVQACGGGRPGIVPLLLSIAKATRSLNTIALRDIGLAPGQDRLIEALDPEDPMPGGVLASEIGVRPSTVSKMLDRLEREGFVQRINSKCDSRVTLVALTPKGVRMQEKIRDAWRWMSEDLVKAVPDDEVTGFATGLTSACAVLQRRIGRLR
ncbi:MarR family winged helix-turn-helix transcriptional regulator [Jiella sp. M17.18]|uniref:MarR family winged helix-turn-helix transcriptional regulator n=1 Tax=Jiella sp. M17.18 TaxID=3234247 RepID=UPI0034DEECCB